MVNLVMDHLLMVLVLLWSSGLQAEDKHQSTAFQCGSTAKADIMLLIEVYESISPEDYRNIKSFLAKIVSIFDIGPKKVQIGLHQYGSEAQTSETLWKLNTHQTKQSLLKAIANLQQEEGRSPLGRILNLVLNTYFIFEYGMRTESQKVGILISDTDTQDLSGFDDSQIQRDTSIEVYTIGVKNVNMTQLRAIASHPDEIYVYGVSNFSFLLDIVDDLTIKLCHSALVPVRLVSGTSLCSGRLEVKSEKSWSSVCETDFDQNDAEVVCRELECGPPSVLQGVLYEEVDAPTWTKEFQCGGRESSLSHCGRSARSTCPSSKAVELTCLEHVSLLGGASRCAGLLKVKQGEWRAVSSLSALKDATVACTALDCGFAVSVEMINVIGPAISTWSIKSDCIHSGSTLWDCATPLSSPSIVKITCSESVRLVSGTSLCSGRLKVKSEQSWFSVCEADFDQQDANVICRELGCGPPSVFQGVLYEEVDTPMWTKELQCGGHESSLLDCGRSDSARSTCSLGKAVRLTCSEPVRLVGRASRCAGTVELKQIVENSGVEWRPVTDLLWTLKEAAAVCRALNCGPAVSTEGKKEPDRPAYFIVPKCVESGSSLRDCALLSSFSSIVEITCSDPVRLVSETSLCSGRLEVKSEQSWSTVCVADFDQQDAKVVCRELGCGVPSVLQGVLYEEVDAPMWTREFQCRGLELSLLDCGRSDTARSTCSLGKAVRLTCSEPVRLVGGASRCAGTLEVKQVEWRPVSIFLSWNLKRAAIVCRALNCGSAVSMGVINEPSGISVWTIKSDCDESVSGLSDCASPFLGSSPSVVEITCSESVRLVSGTSLCSGRLEVKSEQSWFSVCEADFDQQDAEVVCRELGCEAPSVLQGVLYEEVNAPMWTSEFQCRGHESSLLDCRRSDSARSTCSLGKAVRLTCSEPVRLMGGASRCAGTLEVKQVVWRQVSDNLWTLKEAAVACKALDCGSAVSTGSRNETSGRYVWWFKSECVQSRSSLRDCATLALSSTIVELICSDLLVQPVISLSSTMSGVSKYKQHGFWVRRGSNFTINCSIKPQYSGGSFQLTFTSSNMTHNYTQPAVNHSAEFLFSAADPAHQGSYSCVYNIYVLSHDFSSQSRLLSLTIQDATIEHITRLVVLLVTLPLVVTAIYFILKANRGQKSCQQENIELNSYSLGVPRAEGEPVEEERAQGAD